MPSAIVLRRSGGNLRGGKFSFVARTQRAVNEALIACGREGVGADGVFGRKSEEAVEQLAECPGFGDLGIGSGQPNDGTMTAPLWSRLFPAEPLPTVEQRAHVLWLTHEATDYDQAVFNFEPSGEPQRNDLHSFLTWGPYGATVGHGREVQQGLRRSEVDALLDGCFGRRGRRYSHSCRGRRQFRGSRTGKVRISRSGSSNRLEIGLSVPGIEGRSKGRLR